MERAGWTLTGREARRDPSRAARPQRALGRFGRTGGAGRDRSGRSARRASYQHRLGFRAKTKTLPTHTLARYGGVVKMTSTLALERIGDAARQPYVTLERYTRPMIKHGGWVNRRRSRMLSGDLPNLFTALSAPLPSRAMDGVQAGHSLRFTRLITAYAPDDATGCRGDDAWFGNLSGHFTLHAFIEDAVQNMAALEPSERKALALRLQNGGWTLTMCLEPTFASISWFETDDRRGCTFLQTLEWTLFQGKEAASIAEIDGIRRPVQISALVLLAAAEIFAAANAANPDSLPLSSGTAPASVTPENEEAGAPAREPASSDHQSHDDNPQTGHTPRENQALPDPDPTSRVCVPSRRIEPEAGLTTSYPRRRTHDPASHHYALF